MFLALTTRFGLPKRSDADAAAVEDMSCQTVHFFLRYHGDGPKELLVYGYGDPLGRSVIPSMLMWRLFHSYSSSAMPLVAQRLLSVPGHAAEM